MCGDPPNIIIGTSLHYSFADFISNTGVMAFVCLGFVIFYFYFAFRKELVAGKNVRYIPKEKLSPASAITSKADFIKSSIIFFFAVTLLVTHAQTGLSVAFIGIVIAALTLLASGEDAGKVIKKVDFKTILFFIGLFVVVGGLEETGVLETIADLVGKFSGGNLVVMIAIILWVSAGFSAVVDNIPFAATMLPVIKTLAAAGGVNLPVLAWTLAVGTDIGGSATPIGASANVVGMAIAEKEGYKVTWGRYCRTAIPATVLVIGISMMMIYLRYV